MAIMGDNSRREDVSAASRRLIPLTQVSGDIFDHNNRVIDHEPDR